MKFDCNIKCKYDFKRVNTIANSLKKTMEESITDVLKNIRGYAIRLENGHNSVGILFEMVDLSENKVKGRVYADPSKFLSNGESYLWFEYFGTGVHAEKEHVGKTNYFIKSRLYTMAYTCKQSTKGFELSNYGD